MYKCTESQHARTMNDLAAEGRVPSATVVDPSGQRHEFNCIWAVYEQRTYRMLDLSVCEVIVNR